MKKGFVVKLIITMLALVITAGITPGIYINGLWAGFWAALILGIVNILIKPVFTILTLPLTILTLGLFIFVINGLMLLITAALVPGFTVSGFFAAIIGSIILSICTWVINKVLD